MVELPLRSSLARSAEHLPLQLSRSDHH